jgi:hypothetical protein
VPWGQTPAPTHHVTAAQKTLLDRGASDHQYREKNFDSFDEYTAVNLTILLMIVKSVAAHYNSLTSDSQFIGHTN